MRDLILPDACIRGTVPAAGRVDAYDATGGTRKSEDVVTATVDAGEARETHRDPVRELLWGVNEETGDPRRSDVEKTR